jgi:hypothetical protein
VADNIKSAADSIPILGAMLENLRPATRSALETPHLAGTCLALLVMLSLAAWAVHLRVKPE